MLHIFNNDDFIELIGDLAYAVYFNPMAPQNMVWCVTDKYSHFGGIKYQFETNTLLRESTNDLIISFINNLSYLMVEQLTYLRKSVITEKQIANYNNFHKLIRHYPFRSDYIKKLKEKAYEGKNMTMALWDKLGLTIEKTQITLRVNKSKIRKNNIC
jgi:hypothetical protein